MENIILHIACRLEPNYLVSLVKLKLLKALPRGENEETGYSPRTVEFGVFIPHGKISSFYRVSFFTLTS